MRPDVTVNAERVIVRPKPDDAVPKLRRLRLRDKVATGGRLTEEERDLALLALLQKHDLLT